MAQVSITIRKNANGADSTIQVSGVVDDAALAPFTDQLATLLATAANAPEIPPLPPLQPATGPSTTTTSTSMSASA